MLLLASHWLGQKFSLDGCKSYLCNIESLQNENEQTFCENLPLQKLGIYEKSIRLIKKLMLTVCFQKRNFLFLLLNVVNCMFTEITGTFITRMSALVLPI